MLTGLTLKPKVRLNDEIDICLQKRISQFHPISNFQTQAKVRHGDLIPIDRIAIVLWSIVCVGIMADNLMPIKIVIDPLPVFAATALLAAKEFPIEGHSFRYIVDWNS